MILEIIAAALTTLCVYLIIKGILLIDEIERITYLYNKDRIWVSDSLTELLNAMRSMDDRGMFEKDDEVGVAFQTLIKLIEDYNKRLKP